MLVCRAFVRVVRNVQLHELVEAAEPVAKARVFNSLLVRYHVVVEGLQMPYRVDQEKSVAGNLRDRVIEERDLHDCRQGGQRLQILPSG